MTRLEFLNDLKIKLGYLSEEEREKTLTYYNEIIDDRLENGMSEEEAVEQMESTYAIAKRLSPENCTHRTTSEKLFDFIYGFFTKHGYLFVLAILVFSFPIWGPIVLGILSFVSTIFLILFAMIVFGAVASIVALGIALSFVTQSLLSALAALGVSMFLAGLTILITLGTRKLINKLSIFCKTVYKNIKDNSGRWRYSK